MDKTNLHICEDSVKSGDLSDKRQCMVCLPEYYCVDYCGEGSISSYISWQHFPRSTSSRSRCDEDLSEDTRKSLTEIELPGSKQEEKETSRVSTIVYPRTKSNAELQIFHYFEIRHIFELFNFLMSHLVCNEPDDPVTFLEDLLDKCLKFRDDYGEPPLLFTHAHIKSLYHAFDPFERGYLKVEQYHEAIKALGLSLMPYNKEPPLNEEGFVNESDFIFEVSNNFIQNLRQMLRIPKKWEESRTRWRRRMAKMKSKQILKKTEIENKKEFLGEEGEFEHFSKRFSVYENKPVGFGSNLRREPQQLFLD